MNTNQQSASKIYNIKFVLMSPAAFSWLLSLTLATLGEWADGVEEGEGGRRGRRGRRGSGGRKKERNQSKECE